MHSSGLVETEHLIICLGFAVSGAITSTSIAEELVALLKADFINYWELDWQSEEVRPIDSAQV